MPLRSQAFSLKVMVLKVISFLNLAVFKILCLGVGLLLFSCLGFIWLLEFVELCLSSVLERCDYFLKSCHSLILLDFLILSSMSSVSQIFYFFVLLCYILDTFFF